MFGNNGFAKDKNGDTWCWGHNTNGRLGVGTSTVVNPPIIHPWALQKQIKDIKTGSLHTLFLLENGDLYSAGSNSAGRTGLGLTSGERTTPQFVTSGVLEIKVGDAHNYILKEDGWYCFGEGL